MRALFATPLRVDARSNDVAAGLCTTWQASQGGRVWRFRCTHAAAIALQLRHLAHTPGSDGYWMFRRATEISARDDVVRVVLRAPWLRFPYALTAATAAVPGLPGPFRMVHARRGELVVRRGGLTVRFVQLRPDRAAVLFRRGLLDEAPVPLGDIRAALADRTVARAVRARPLLAVDLISFRGAGALGDLPQTRHVYWQTADRADYDALVSEGESPAAVSFVPGLGQDRTPARAYRAAKARIPSLPPVRVSIAAEGDPAVRYGASLLIASWRDLGLGARAWTGGQPDAVAARLAAAYPQDEALVGPLGPNGTLFRALNQTRELALADSRFFERAKLVPVAWAVDARFVSPRVRGWSEDRLGDVDYARVTVAR